MRLYKHLNEMTASQFKSGLSQENWEMIKSMIEKDCKPFLNDFKGAKNVLWRGLQRGSADVITRKSTRTDREPRFLDKSLSNMLSSYAKDKWGWDTRKEGLFVTSDETLAKHYGRPVIVFPIGQYKVVWNPDVYQLYEAYDDWKWLVANEADDVRNEWRHIKTDDDIKRMSKKLKRFDKEMKKLDYQPSKDLPVEEMIYAHAEDVIFDSYLKRHLDNYTSGNMNKYLKMKSKGYSEAIVKCNEYYMIPWEWKAHLIGGLGK